MNIKKIISSLVAIIIVVFISNSFAKTQLTDSDQNLGIVSIYGTDEIPPPEALKGYSNKTNLNSREGFYARKEYPLQNYLMQKLSTEEKINTRVKINDLMMQKHLGIDFPIEKQKKLSQIYRTMQEEVERILKLRYYDGKISEKESGRLFFKNAERWLISSAEILTDEEFSLMFDIKKNEIENYLRFLLNCPSVKANT